MIVLDPDEHPYVVAVANILRCSPSIARGVTLTMARNPLWELRRHKAIFHNLAVESYWRYKRFSTRHQDEGEDL